MRQLLFVSALGMAGAFCALASVDAGLLALVPSGAKIVGALDVTHARNSEFGQYLLSKAQAEDAHFQEMITETGFDPRKDLQYVLFAANGPSAGGVDSSSSFAILARGTFNQNKIKTLATSKGSSLVTYGGVDMLLNGKEAAHQTAVAFMDSGVAVMADVATLKQIIDSRAAPAILDSDLKSKIQNIGSGNDAWFVSLVAGASFLGEHTGPQGAPQAKALQGVVQSSGGVKFGPTIDTTLDAVTRSERDAQSLSDVIRFMAGLVQMQRQSDAKAGILASALDGMTLQNSGTAVHFAVSMPEKSLEQLADAAPHAGVAH